MNKWMTTAISGVFVMLAGVVHAECVESLAVAKPDYQYAEYQSGMVTDVEVGLTWQKCSLGQEAVDGECTGEPADYNWHQAHQAAEEANAQMLLGHNDWRLPSVAELRTLVAKNCHAPAINSTLFPGTPSAIYWSSSVSAADHIGAWFVSFNNGNENTYYKDSSAYVRLVRNH